MTSPTTQAQRTHVLAYINKDVKIFDPKKENALLVTLIQSKNENGFNILYNKYCDALYGTILKLVKRKDVADDLLQDTFVKIWKHIDSYDNSKGTLYTWMLNIARNHAVDYLRSANYKHHLLQVEIDLCAYCIDSLSNSNSYSCVFEYSDLRNKAMRLDIKYSEVIDLIYFYGWTQEQTAKILKLPLGTIKTRARKGLNLLKILYQNQ